MVIGHKFKVVGKYSTCDCVGKISVVYRILRPFLDVVP